MSTSKRPILRILARIFVEIYQNTLLVVCHRLLWFASISDHYHHDSDLLTAALCVDFITVPIVEAIRSGI